MRARRAVADLAVGEIIELLRAWHAGDDTAYARVSAVLCRSTNSGASANNRKVHEVTVTGSRQLLKSTDRGSGQFNLQVSWLEREPSFQGAGLASASALMFFAQVRYNLP